MGVVVLLFICIFLHFIGILISLLYVSFHIFMRILTGMFEGQVLHQRSEMFTMGATSEPANSAVGVRSQSNQSDLRRGEDVR